MCDDDEDVCGEIVWLWEISRVLRAALRAAHHEYIALALCIDEEVERMGFLEPLQRIRREGEGMTPSDRRLRT